MVPQTIHLANYNVCILAKLYNEISNVQRKYAFPGTSLEGFVHPTRISCTSIPMYIRSYTSHTEIVNEIYCLTVCTSSEGCTLNFGHCKTCFLCQNETLGYTYQNMCPDRGENNHV